MIYQARGILWPHLGIGLEVLDNKEPGRVLKPVWRLNPDAEPPEERAAPPSAHAADGGGGGRVM